MHKKIPGLCVVALLLLTTVFVATVGGKTNNKNEINKPNETNMVNSIKATIVKPRSGFLYICNQEIIYCGMTIILGPRQGIEVWVDVPDEEQMSVSYIEFYINGKISGIGNWDPFRQYYTWRCTELGIGLWTLTAQAICEDSQNGDTVDAYPQTEQQDGVTMFYFNFRVLQPRK